MPRSLPLPVPSQGSHRQVVAQLRPQFKLGRDGVGGVGLDEGMWEYCIEPWVNLNSVLSHSSPSCTATFYPYTSLLYISFIIIFLNAKLESASYLTIPQLWTLLTIPIFPNLFPWSLPLSSPVSTPNLSILLFGDIFYVSPYPVSQPPVQFSSAGLPRKYHPHPWI